MAAGRAFEWTPKQAKAIAALEAALALAQRAQLTICGMESTLLVYKTRELDEAEQAARMCGAGLYEAQHELANVREHVHALDHRGAYRDSGGW